MSFRVYGDDSSEATDDLSRFGAFAAQSAYEAGGGVYGIPQDNLDPELGNSERKGAAYSIRASRSHDYSGQDQPTYANGRTKKG